LINRQGRMSEVYITCPYRKFFRHRPERIGKQNCSQSFLSLSGAMISFCIGFYPFCERSSFPAIIWTLRSLLSASNGVSLEVRIHMIHSLRINYLFATGHLINLASIVIGVLFFLSTILLIPINEFSFPIKHPNEGDLTIYSNF
jgi:hypothetical protein